MAIEVLPSDTLMECLKERADELGGQGINLFTNAVKKTQSKLLDFYIRPHLLKPDHSYIYIAEDKGKSGRRNYDPANTVAASINGNLALPGRWGLFTNPLEWVDINAIGPRPSDRAINIGFCVYTLEFDNLPLWAQLRAIWNGGVRRTDEILTRFKDYRGFEAVYGGGKSLHFHFVFDLRHWSHDLAFASNSSYQEHWRSDFPNAYLREAHADRWEVVKRAFRRGTGIESEPDRSLRFWEQNRRLPMALRLVKDGHPLGLPAGSYVQQYVLASSVRKNIPRSGKGWLHRSNLIERSAIQRNKRDDSLPGVIRPSSEVGSGAGEDAGRRRFDEFLSANFAKLATGSDLRYGHVELGNEGPKIYLHNDAMDVNASSVIEGDYTNVLLQGRHRYDGDTYPLLVSPNQLYTAMREQNGGRARLCDHVLDQKFADQVFDCDSYRRFLSDHVVAAMEAARLVLILGPEGCGKSSAVMRNIGQLVTDTGEPVFISSPSYAQSAEKIRDFTAMYPHGPHVAFEYLSLTELYQRHCPVGDRISELDALEMGCPSWLRAVHDQQPHVYAKMRAHRDELHQIRRRGQIPILFGVHETVRRHADTGMTRLFYATSFDERWFEQMAPEDRRTYRNKLRFETPFAHVVFDEVSPGDLVSIHPMVDVQWAWDFERSVEQIPQSDKLARYKAFKKYRSTHPRSRDEGDFVSGKSDWAYVQEILHADYSEGDLVRISPERFPFDDDQGMYAQCIGRSYYVAPRMWWSGIDRTTLLTTELVPAQIISALTCRQSTYDNVLHTQADDQERQPYRVFRFDKPGLFEDFVHIENHPHCKKQTLPKLAQSYRIEFPDAVMVSDMLKGRIEATPIITHLSARGSNELNKRDIIAFYTAPSAELFSQLAALDARIGTRNTIALWYVDRFNQTCGRNRGFRGKHGARHIAVMTHRMCRWLMPYLFGWSRYVFTRCQCSLTSVQPVV